MVRQKQMSIARRVCQTCGAECLEGETVCWRCGHGLDEPTSDEQLIDFASTQPSPTTPIAPNPPTVLKTTLTGEVVEVPDFSAMPATAQTPKPPEAPSALSDASAPEPVFRMTYCRTCGIQNDEGAVECRKCHQPLPVLTGPPPDLTPLRRSWGFDVLGLAWIALGASAVYCGRFLIKADPAHPGVTWADYFWTGVVVCAPGVMIFLRHYFCKFLFWLLTFGSMMVWSVIGFLWLYVGLHVSDNGRVGLMWLAALSLLSGISFLTVRLNDEFDFGT